MRGIVGSVVGALVGLGRGYQQPGLERHFAALDGIRHGMAQSDVPYSSTLMPHRQSRAVPVAIALRSETAFAAPKIFKPDLLFRMAFIARDPSALKNRQPRADHKLGDVRTC